MASEEVEQVIFHKIKSLMEVNQQTLYELMAAYDYENTGTILVQDLVRAFKKYGMLHPEPHIPVLLKIGGATESDDKIDYVVFSQQLLSQVAKQAGMHTKRNNDLVLKVAATLQAKKMSPFEFFCTLDVNCSGRVSKIELKTGMQSIAINISTTEFNDLWKMVKKPVKKLANKRSTEFDEGLTKKGGKNVESKVKVSLEDLSYYELL